MIENVIVWWMDGEHYKVSLFNVTTFTLNNNIKSWILFAIGMSYIAHFSCTF